MSKKLYHENLGAFIEELEKHGELIRIQQSVSRDLEISEIYFRQIRSPGGGKALLFENVGGSDIPVLINAFGSKRRMEIAFGQRSFSEIAKELKKLLSLIQMKKPAGISDIMDQTKNALKIFKFPPRKVSSAPCQEIVWRENEIDLNNLPVLKSWPKDGGRFITLPLVITRSRKDGSVNMGMYRMQILDRNATAMHWQIHKDGSHYYQEYVQAQERMPVSVVIGADPSLIFSATAPLPPRMSELLLAGFLRTKAVPVVKCLTNDLLVPAEAEIVLEGYVDPLETVPEGPFGDHTGYYTPVEPFPVFHITAITMRKNAVYSATVVGRSPQEDCYLAEATEQLFLPLLQVVAPEVKDQMLPWDGCFHNCAVFSVDKHFPFQAKRLMSHLWGFSQMSFARSLVMVDSGVDLHSGRALFDHILDTVDIKEDLLITEGILDQLDHSGIRPLWGGKIGVDATSKMEGEKERTKIKKRKLNFTSVEEKKLSALLKKARVHVTDIRLYGSKLRNPVLILSVTKKQNEGKILTKIHPVIKKYFRNGPLVVLCVDRDVGDDSLVLWRLLGNTDPLRDMIRPDDSSEFLLIDATSKNKADGYTRKWPEENLMDQKTIKLVDSKWRAMFGEKPFAVKRP